MTVLHKEFNFTLEVCASATNRAIPSVPYMGLDNNRDAINYDWTPCKSGQKAKDVVSYCNPPYSKLPQFAEAATRNFVYGYVKTSVLLVPAYTDTKWFDNLSGYAAEVRFLKGRLRFWEDGKPGKYGARFPSAVIVLNNSSRPDWYEFTEVLWGLWDWKKSLSAPAVESQSS